MLLVCVINHNQTQCRLYAEMKLTLEKALEIAEAQETANKNVKELVPKKEETVLGMKSSRSKVCYHCGISGHASSELSIKDVTSQVW